MPTRSRDGVAAALTGKGIEDDMRLIDSLTRVIEVSGDPLACLTPIGRVDRPPQLSPSLFVIGVDARGVHTKSDFAALLRRHKRGVPRIPSSVSHIIIVIQLADDLPDVWVSTRVHRWVLSIHRRMQRTRGVDADVAALLVNRSVSSTLIAVRLEELAQRPPGANPAAVLTLDEIRGQTIAQASTNDFI